MLRKILMRERSALLLVLFLVVLSDVSHAIPRTVNGTGEACYVSGYNYDTIQAAIDESEDGDTIIVCQNGSGQYTENVNINKSVNLFGNETYVRVNASDPAMHVFNITSESIAISNFTLFDSDSYGLTANSTNLTLSFINSSNSYGGFFIHGYGQNISVFNCTANNSRAEGFVISSFYPSILFYNNTAYGNYWGFRIHQASNMLFAENFAYLNSYGFVFDNLQNSSITNNTALSNNMYGFWFQYINEGNNFTENNASYSGVLDLMVDEVSCNNTIENNFGTGGLPINFTNVSVNWENISASEILLCNADYSNLSNVTIYAAGRNGVVLSSTDFTIIRDSNLSNSRYGVYLFHSNNNSLYNLSISQTDLPIYLLLSSDNNISESNFKDDTSDRIRVDLSNYNRFFNNLLDGPYISVESSHHNIISHNNMSNFFFYGMTFAGTSNTSVFGNQLSSNAGYGFVAANSIDNNFTANDITLTDAHGTGIYLASGVRNIISSNNIRLLSIFSTTGIQLLFRNEENQIVNNTISNAKYGLFLRVSNNTIIANNTFNANNLSIFLNHTSVENSIFDNIIENGTVGITLDGENISNNSYYYNSFVNVSFILNITNTSNLTSLGYLNNASNFSFSVDIIEGGVFVNETISPASDPENYTSLGNYLNITNYTFANVSVYFGYTDEELIERGIPENQLKLYKHNGTDWIQLDTIVDSVNNIAYSENITSFSVFSLMGEPVSNLVVNGSGFPCTLGREYHSTIQSAIDAVSDGDTIIVCQNGSGEYLENVLINKQINLYGNESGVRVNASLSSDHVFEITANNVNISNFTVSGATESSSSGIYLISGNYSSITNIFSFNNVYGIYLSSSSNNTISNNSAYNNPYGIFLSSSSSNTISNNYAYNNTNPGISLYLSSNNTLVNNSAYNNSYGFVVSSSSSNTFSNNSAYNNSFGIYLSSSSNNTISNNSAYNNTNYGISLSSSSNSNTISNNSVYNNGLGIVLEPSSNSNTILNNSVYNNNNRGIFLFSNSNNTLVNNSAYNNMFGISLSSISNSTISNNLVYNNGLGIVLEPSSNSNTISNNSAYNNGYGLLLSSISNNTISNNSAYNNSVGIYLSSSSNNTISNNYAYNNTNHGISLSLSSNNTLVNNSAYNNQYGLYLYNSNETIVNSHIYNNSIADLHPHTEAETSYRSLSNLTIDNPLGNFQNYTSIDIYDTLTATEEYSIKWSTNSTSLPSGRVSFNQKFINISTISGSPSIDQINWTWLDSETTGYNKSNLELIRYDGSSWSLLNNSPDTTSNILSMSNMVPASIYALVENTAPLALSIQYPENITYNTSTIELNYTVSNSDSCWYSNDSGVTNATLASCNNASISGYSEGSHTITVYSNDSLNIVSSESVSFTVDTTPPNVTILSPSHGYSTTVGTTISISVNVTDSTTNISSVLANISKDGSYYSTVTLEYSSGLYGGSFSSSTTGAYNLTIIANDSVNNINSSESVLFTLTPSACTDCDVVTREHISWSSSTICPDNKIKITTEPNTRISLFHRPTITSVSATSNSEGIALFSPVGEGTYSITLSKEGFRTTEGDFSHTNCPPSLRQMSVSNERFCPENQITFTVLETETASPLASALVSFNSISQRTNTNGQAVFSFAESGSYPISVTKEGYSAYSATDSFELCPLRTMGFTWSALCRTKQVILFVFDTETRGAIPGASVGDFGTTNSAGELALPSEEKSFTFGISKEGYRNISAAYHLFDYSCDEGNKTIYNETNSSSIFTPPGGDSGNKPNKTITNQTNQTNITIPFTPGFPSSGNAVENFISNIDFFKKTIVDYISETEEKKNFATIISIIALFLILLLVYLRFIAKKI